MAIVFEEKRGGETRPVSSREDFERILSDPSLAKRIELIRSNNETYDILIQQGQDEKAKQIMRETAQVKTQLPGFVFQCSRFEPHDWEIKKSKKKMVTLF